ncbi:MAG: hypothetical protein MZU91_05355 [Desulfosudis oleivorans]|nr:hypothetical protein [Desulfosudis oleivorans]
MTSQSLPAAHQGGTAAGGQSRHQHGVSEALNKIGATRTFSKKKSLTDQNLCVVGDDLPDLPLLRRCGFHAPFPTALPRCSAALIMLRGTLAAGGLVREVCELVLKAQGLWEQMTARYY